MRIVRPESLEGERCPILGCSVVCRGVLALRTHTYRHELVLPVTTSSDLRVCGSWHFPSVLEPLEVVNNSKNPCLQKATNHGKVLLGLHCRTCTPIFCEWTKNPEKKSRTDTIFEKKIDHVHVKTLHTKQKT